jgi:hypothetical protein
MCMVPIVAYALFKMHLALVMAYIFVEMHLTPTMDYTPFWNVFGFSYELCSC